jgi:hypothetical protein
VNWDISPILDAWEYQPGEVMVRALTGEDGQEKLQLRMDLGLLQMNRKGRPDGRRPHGHATLLDYHRAKCLREAKGNLDEEPTLSGTDCLHLQLESIQYHHRCMCLFQLDDFAGVVADAAHNLALLDFVENHAPDSDAVWGILQFRAQVLMIQTRALASVALKELQYDAAEEQVASGVDQIREFYRTHGHEDFIEHCDETQMLEDWLEEIRAQRPISEKERLEIALKEAVTREDYEKAAHYRDALRDLENHPRKSST